MNPLDAILPGTDNKLPAPPTPIERFTPPRLSIAILLIWTTVTAVLLKLSLAIGYSPDVKNYLDNASQFMRTISFGASSIMNILLAAGLVGMGVILLARIRGAKGRLLPGHWLLIIYTLNDVLLAAKIHGQRLVEHMVRENMGGRPNMSIVVVLALTAFLIRLAILLVPCLWAAFRSKGGWHWTAALCLLPASELIHVGLKVVLFRLLSLQSFGMLSMIMGLTYLVIPGLAVLGAVSFDLYKGQRRDWLHWIGVAIVVVPMLFAIGRLAIYLIFFKGG